MKPDEHVAVTINGQPHDIPADQSILAACMRVDSAAAPRVTCGMGSCYACVVTRNGEDSVRSCITQVQDGDSYDW